MLRTVGERTVMTGRRKPADKQDLSFREVPRASKKAINLRIDVPLILVAATLVIFGLVMVYSASYYVSELVRGNASYVFYRQVLWLGIGLVSCGVLAFVDYHHWRKLALPAMVVIVGSLVAVLLLNNVRNGAVRTLWGGSIQPSEAAKLVTIIYLAVWLFTKREKIKDINFGLIPMAAILGVLGGLIFLQPDLSAVLTIVILGGMMFFLGGGDIRQIAILILIMLVVGVFIVRVNPTGSTRVQEYMAGLKDPIQASYHVRRAIEAFVRGGIFGVGIGNGVTKRTGLPVPHTDSIFAVVGEETGLLGCVALAVLYGLLLWRGLTIARRAPDALGTLLAAGLSVWICVEAFINMSVMVNLLPFAGNALPFISSGGSSLVVTLAAVGILLNISRNSVQKDDDGRIFGAVVDLRWRDRRRRVPGARRPTNHAD